MFLPFDVRTLDQEYRRGVDAVRYQASIGDLSEIDVGFVMGASAQSQTSAAFLQARTNFQGQDYQVTLIDYADQVLLGVGVEGSLGSSGYWAEVSTIAQGLCRAAQRCTRRLRRCCLRMA